jgi:hypothetical protein
MPSFSFSGSQNQRIRSKGAESEVGSAQDDADGTN